MIVVREIMCCKPGKVRPLVEKFLAMGKLMEKKGHPKMRVLTDVAGARFWTVVAELEAANLKAFEEMMEGPAAKEDMQEFEAIMKGYHDLVDHGRREIFKIEG